MDLSFFEKEFYYNTVGNWAISLIIIFGAVLLARALYWVLQLLSNSVTSKTSSKMDDILVQSSTEPGVFVVAVLASWYGLERLRFPDSLDHLIGNAYYFLLTIGVTWLLVRLIDAVITHYLQPIALRTESNFDDQLLPVVQKGARWVIWILGIIVALNNAGYNVSAIIAGMGIGGLAFAMAAKDSISNIFGGFTIFTDKPFKINDRIIINGFDGTVIEIGIRSTRLKTLEGRIVTIPNSKFTDGIVENISLEPSRKVILKLGLVYHTTPEQMDQAMQILSNIHANNDLLEENVNVAFTDFGDFSLGITFIYYIKKGNDIFNTRSGVNLEILKRFKAAGLEMAFPTQTIYHIKEG